MDRFLMRRVTSVINRLVGEGEDVWLAGIELSLHAFDNPVSRTGTERAFEGGNDELTLAELSIAADELLDVVEVGAGVLNGINDDGFLAVFQRHVTAFTAHICAAWASVIAMEHSRTISGL